MSRSVLMYSCIVSSCRVRWTHHNPPKSEYRWEKVKGSDIWWSMKGAMVHREILRWCTEFLLLMCNLQFVFLSACKEVSVDTIDIFLLYHPCGCLLDWDTSLHCIQSMCPHVGQTLHNQLDHSLFRFVEVRESTVGSFALAEWKNGDSNEDKMFSLAWLFFFFFCSF